MGSIFERQISRERFIKGIALGSVMTAGTAFTLWERQTRFLERAASLLVESPDVATLLSANDSYKGSPIFQLHRVCPARPFNPVPVFGDSIARGGTGKDPQPYAGIFAKRATELGFGVWQDYNYAEHGATTDLVIKQQLLSPRSEEARNLPMPKKIILQVGPNNIKDIASTKEKIQLLQYLLKNPRDPAIIEVASDVVSDVRSFGRSFRDVLGQIIVAFGKNHIDNIIVMTALNFSKAPQISLIEGNESEFYFPIVEDSTAQFFVQKSTLLLNTEMTNATEAFARSHPEIRITAIDTYDFPKDGYSKDEHPNDEGKKWLAERLYDHLELQKVPA